MNKKRIKPIATTNPKAAWQLLKPEEQQALLDYVEKTTTQG